MHVPDGFIAPQVYLPAYGVAAGFWTYAIRRVRRELGQEMLPYLSVLTALGFVASSIMLPLPGGTSVHLLGIAMLAVLFGIWIAFVAASMVLALQATLLGAGGITALALNALAVGLAGGAVARGVHRVLHQRWPAAALFLAGWLSVMAASLLTALVLGIQPAIAHTADGTPLFFPFGLEIVLPAVLLPHAVAGVGEGMMTVLVVRLVERMRRGAGGWP